MEELAANLSKEPNIKKDVLDSDGAQELDTSSRVLNERKEKIKLWLKNPYNLILLGILIFSFIILIYYFNLTKDQPLWYDEGEYMSTANYWAFGIPYNIHPARPPLFPFLVAIMFKLGLGLLSVKFLLEIIPALLTIVFIYLLVNEMYGNKKLALITAFILSVSWIHLFYTMRLMTDSIGFLFGILAILCFWKGHINNKGKIYIWLIGMFVSLSFLSRLAGVLYGFLILSFLVLTLQFNFLKNKNMWISFIISLLTISPYLIWGYFYYGNALAFKVGSVSVSPNPLGWSVLQFVYDYPEFIFFILFLVGLITFLPMLLSLDRLILKKDKKYYNDLFVIFNLIFTLFFFIYFLRGAENRWLMMMSISIFIISAKGIILVYEIIKKNIGKVLGIIAVLLILSAGAYYELKHADMIINLKKDSYSQVKDAALWIKENSNPDDIIVSASHTQMTYYSERKMITHFNFTANRYFTSEEFDKVIADYKPKYYVVSVFEPSIPQWTYSYPENKSNFQPVKAWFSDAEQKQPILIIYQITYDNIISPNI